MARTKKGGTRFFLKKEAKTFANWRWLPWRRQPQVEKVFWFFFSKKNRFLSLLPHAAESTRVNAG